MAQVEKLEADMAAAAEAEDFEAVCYISYRSLIFMLINKAFPSIGCCIAGRNHSSPITAGRHVAVSTAQWNVIDRQVM